MIPNRGFDSLRYGSQERRKPPERTGNPYRPSSVAARRHEFGKRKDTGGTWKRWAVAGILTVGLLTGGIIGMGHLNQVRAQENIAAEVAKDPLIVDRAELAQKYNIFIHDVEGRNYVRLDLRRGIEDEPKVKLLEQSKAGEKNGGPRRELHMVLVDSERVTPDCLSREQAKEMPGLELYLTGKFLENHPDKKFPIGTFYEGTEEDGVVRTYIVVPVRLPDKLIDHPSSQDYVWDMANTTYPLRNASLLTSLEHEWSHFVGLDHPMTDIVGVGENIDRAHKQFTDTGSDRGYLFHIITPEQSVIAQLDTLTDLKQI